MRNEFGSLGLPSGTVFFFSIALIVRAIGNAFIEVIGVLILRIGAILLLSVVSAVVIAVSVTTVGFVFCIAGKLNIHVPFLEAISDRMTMAFTVGAELGFIETEIDIAVGILGFAFVGMRILLLIFGRTRGFGGR